MSIINFILIFIITIILFIFIKEYGQFKRDIILKSREAWDRLADDESKMDQEFFDPIDIIMEPIDITKFHKLPEKGSTYAAAHDVYWSTVNKELNEDGSVTIEPGETLKFGTNLKVMITIDNFYLDMCSRSGASINKGLVVINAPGRIDSDYRGELLVGLKNTSDKPITIEPQSRIAQCSLHREIPAYFGYGDVIDNTDRGDGGLGHTGETTIN